MALKYLRIKAIALTQDDNEITILTVNYNTSDFIEVQLEAFHRLSKNNFKVYIADNGSNKKHLEKLALIAQKFSNVNVFYRIQSAPGSIGHAEAVDFLISNVSTRYFLVMDSDAVILLKNWDSEFIKILSQGYGALGAPPVKGSDKPLDFPFAFVVFLETEVFKKLKCSFMPVRGMETKGKDTGFLVREQYFKNGLRSLCFEDKNTRFFKTGPYGSILCAEYYWPWDLDNIIACHFARGATDGVAKYKNTWYYKIPLLSKIIKKIQGKIDRKRWISLTRKLLLKRI